MGERCGEKGVSTSSRAPDLLQVRRTLRQPLGQLGGSSADRQMNNQACRIRHALSRRKIAQYDLVSCALEFPEFVVESGSVRRVFAPHVALFLEIALSAAIDIC